MLSFFGFPDRLSVSYSRSSGPGGQNVNKGKNKTKTEYIYMYFLRTNPIDIHETSYNKIKVRILELSSIEI